MLEKYRPFPIKRIEFRFCTYFYRLFMPIHTTKTWPQKLIDQRLKHAPKVTAIHIGSPADKMGIKPGWKLLQIDGIEAQNN